MLEDAGAEGQVVYPEWIHWYDNFPEPAESIITRNNFTFYNTLPHPRYLST